MTQSSLQTQCPKCRTRFRVTDEQLGIAKGKVRCGHCMDVFNAVDHQVTSGAGDARKASPGTSSKTPPQSPPSESTTDDFASNTTEEDFIFVDNPEEDAEEGRYAGTKLTFSDDELSDSFRSFDDRDSSTQDEADDDHKEHIDESWAEAILQEDNAPERTTPEPEPAITKEVSPEPEPEPEPENDNSGAATDEANALERQQEESFSANAPFGDLRHDPVSVDTSNKSWLRTLVWLIIVLGLIGALVAQVTWFQFDRLSAVPELRPFYEKGCELAGCELTPLVNVEAIQSRKLVVRTDPENRSQLIVDAVIINRADFQQPFPAIALTFSNLNGDVVAQSVFTPSEFLAGEADKLDVMPVETPVRIAISIRDPGRDAVNYNISFRPYAP